MGPDKGSPERRATHPADSRSNQIWEDGTLLAKTCPADIDLHDCKGSAAKIQEVQRRRCHHDPSAVNYNRVDLHKDLMLIPPGEHVAES